MSENINETLTDLILNKLDSNITVQEIDLDLSLFEDGLGLDSIALAELITLVEDEFKFTFDEDDLTTEPFKTLRTLSTFVEEKVSNLQSA